MSSSEVQQQEKAQNIQIRRVRIHSESQLPADYGTTPGGTMFGTTPGGTRIIYDRAFLLECRNSPLAQSPLANLPRIPGVTCPAVERGSPKSGSNHGGGGSPKSSKAPAGLPPAAEQKLETVKEDKSSKKPSAAAGASGDDPQFDMDI